MLWHAVIVTENVLHRAVLVFCYECAVAATLTASMMGFDVPQCATKCLTVIVTVTLMCAVLCYAVM